MYDIANSGGVINPKLYLVIITLNYNGPAMNVINIVNL